MSAWTVESGHIDVLVAALREYGVLSEADDARQVGQTLWNENYHSVNYRYDENEPAPDYPAGWPVPPTPVRPLDPLAVLLAIDCYSYQSCEHPGWETSVAHSLCEALRRAVYGRHPALGKSVPDRLQPGRMRAAYHDHPRYRTIPWGFDLLAQAYEEEQA